MKKLFLACTMVAMLLPATAPAQEATMSADQVGSASIAGATEEQVMVLLLILAAVAALAKEATPLAPV